MIGLELGSGPVIILIFFHFLLTLPIGSESACRSGCPLALGSYYVSPNLNLTLTYIGSLFEVAYKDLLPYNPNIPNAQFIDVGQRVNVSFPCDCLNGEFLGRTFRYKTLPADTYERVARWPYANLTTAQTVAQGNSYPPTRIPDRAAINVTVKCSCGDPTVSMDYGLFQTYPLRAGESLESVAAGFGLQGKEELLQRYNPGVNFSARSGIVFVPAKG